ncbi:hypothetical protein TSAR_009478 [Trichomalopsis sarcophagae]|uniref:Mutator-like transposase domain-containing protein n=1 Tax=Trichomalopsis sarcophagae TaxID=543379 RepID=A0A232FGY2_9HYME|nr:hypothetical protein TSAR_009478 [Trichomalopsis sarcophagae]
MLDDESDVKQTPDEIVSCKREIGVQGSTWQHREHRSYNGVFTTLGQESGKIIDIEVFSSYCLQCNYYEKVHGSEEYCGYVQKRFGTQLRNLKKNKKLGGKGKLTDKIIDTLQTYYGNAIRAHPDSIEDMTRAIWAIFYHKASTDKNPQHMHCSPGSDSWCKYQKAVAKGKKYAYVHPQTLPEEIFNEIKFVFEKLSEPELLRKYLGGKTQNNISSLVTMRYTIAAVTKDQERIKDDEKKQSVTKEARKLRRL